MYVSVCVCVCCVVHSTVSIPKSDMYSGDNLGSCCWYSGYGSCSPDLMYLAQSTYFLHSRYILT